SVPAPPSRVPAPPSRGPMPPTPAPPSARPIPPPPSASPRPPPVRLQLEEPSPIASTPMSGSELSAADSEPPPSKRPPPPMRSVAPQERAPRRSTRPPAGGLTLEELTTEPYSEVGDLPAPPGLEDRMAIAHGLHRHLAAELTSSTEQPRKARLHYELGHLREFILVDLEEASSHYRKAHGLDSTFEPTIAGLIRVLSLLGQWDSTLSLYDEQVALSANAEDKAGLLFSKAVILQMRLGKLREPRAAYVQALQLAPNEAALLRAVARLARVEKDYPALDQALALQAQATQTDANFAAAHAAERARMIEVQKKNPGQAIEVYQQSFDLDPMASPALIALERLYSSSGQPREHAAILGRRAGLVSNQAAKASALFTAGSLIFESLGDAKDAARYIEAAWKAQPDNL